MMSALGVLPLLLLGCSKDSASDDDSGEAGWAPELHCPGDASGICDDADGPLMAGASAVTITPTCFESWTDVDGDGEYETDEGDEHLDCGCDRLCEGDAGYPGADEGEGDESFQAVWMAGFQNGRAASGVRDDNWARAVVLDKGETRIAIVAVDLVGWFNDDVVATREMLSSDLGIDHLMVSSTHQHEGPDTMGLWGKTATSGGYDPDYAAYVRERTVEAVVAAVADLREVGSLTVGSVDFSTYDDELGTRNLIRDSRDPVIIDEQIGAALLVDTAGETIASLVNWGNHPEAMADENTLITSDYAHAIRESMEDGVDWQSYQKPGLGGVSIYINASVGGLMTPLGVSFTDPDGVVWSDYTFDRADAMGRAVADMAMDALDAGVVDTDPVLAFEAQTLKFPVENWGFQAMFLSGIITRDLYDYDPSDAIDEDNTPTVLTEVNRIQIGPLTMLTVPGEIFPELAVGGYDGSRINSPVEVLISEDNPNPPDLSLAPEGPYWKEMLLTEHAWIVGLGNDELGYIIPPYDFITDETLPYLEEAEGDHYEETNSLGSETATILGDEITRMLDWVAAQ